MHQKTKMLARAALLAFIKIPLGYSSITLQFFFTAMAGCLLGPYWGAASQGVYVLLGLVGLPIFTLGGGFGYVLQPTFGFLLGLIPSALVIGLITRKSRRPLRIILACAAGLATLYAVGLPYMGLVLNVYLDNSPVPPRRRPENRRGGDSVPQAISFFRQKTVIFSV